MKNKWKVDDGWGQQIGPLAGEFKVILRGPDGKVKLETDWFPNLVLTTGKNMLAGVLTGAATPFTRNIGIGTGTTTPLVGDATLTTETGTRVSAGFAVTANTAYYSGLFTANNPPGAEVIAEYGLFSLAAAGYMFVHTTAGGISKATADTLETQYRIAVT